MSGTPGSASSGHLEATTRGDHLRVSSRVSMRSQALILAGPGASYPDLWDGGGYVRQDQFDQALDIGRENKRAIQLMANHCRHARVEIPGGTSFLGGMVGLPIGMAQVRCQYAPAPRHMQMNVMDLAVQFYEENCVGCPFRAPNGVLPTIAVEVENRRREAARRAGEAEGRRASILSAWEDRRMRRRAAVGAEGFATRDVASDLDKIDYHPDAESLVAEEIARPARRRLIEVARLAPELVVPALADSTITLASETGNGTACTVVRLLARAGHLPPRRAIEVALSLLSKFPSVEAGQIVAEFDGELTRQGLEPILDSLVSLAAEEDEFPWSGRRSEPAAFLAASRVDLMQVTDRLLVLLESDEAQIRDEAAQAAGLLLATDPGLVIGLGTALVRSIRGEDEGYAGTPHPAASAARALAAAWRGEPELTRRILEKEVAALGDEAKPELFSVISFLPSFRGQFDEIPERAREVAVDFVLERVGGDWGEEVADRASDMLKDLARDVPATVAAKIDSVLALLLDLCMEPSQSSLLDASNRAPTDPTEAQSRALQLVGRSVSRDGRRRDVAESLGSLAAVAPERVVDRIVMFMQASTGSTTTDSTIRVSLLKALKTAVNAALVARVLPILYTSLLSTDVAVRAAAIDLWTACASTGSTLPEDLALLAETLLLDSYVMVHTAMLDALPGLYLPDALVDRLLPIVAGWARTHEGDTWKEDVALRALLHLARRTSDERLAAWAASFVLGQAQHLSPYDRERVLLARNLETLRSTPEWASRAIELLNDRRSINRFNQRELPVLQALLEEPRGIQSVPFSDVELGAMLHVPDFPWSAAEWVEVLQAAGRWGEADRLGRALLDATPDTVEYAPRRELLALVASAAGLEAVIDGVVAAPDREASIGGADPLQNVLEAVERLKTTIPPDVERWGERLGAVVRARVAVTNALEKARSDPGGMADQLDASAAVYADADLGYNNSPGRARRQFGAALRVAAELLRFDQAVREGDPNADAHRAAARRLAAMLLHDLQDGPIGPHPNLQSFADRASKIADANEVDLAVASLVEVPVPIPIVSLRRLLPVRRLRARPQADEEPETELEPLSVCVLTLDGDPVVDVAVLRPHLVYDLGVELRIEQWPEWADRCQVQLLTTLTPDALTLPSFSWSRADAQVDESGVRLSGSGTIRCAVERRIGQPAIDCPIQVRLSGPSRDHLVEVAGYIRLRLRPFDPSVDALTDHQQVDERLIRLFDPLAEDNTLDPDDVRAFCRFFGACVRGGQAIMFDRAFRVGTHVTEAQFHDELEARLRADPELGGRLTRRDAVAGGFDDLLHDDIIAELKVERKVPATLESCDHYLGQPTQYGVGRGSRLSILVVLDHSRKDAPPGVLENYIGWLVPALHGLHDPRYPSRVGVLIINTNLPVPSAWSLRRIATRDSSDSSSP